MPGGDNDETYIDRVTSYVYDDAGRLKEQIADLPATSDDQVTRYIYSGELADAHDGTVVKTNSALRATLYPDAKKADGTTSLAASDVIDILEGTNTSDPHDFVAYTYNAAGLAATSTDQREVTHTYVYDEIGREIEDDATLPQGTDVDDSILAITTAYDALGRVKTATSHSSAAPDTDDYTDAVNQIQYDYDGWGNLVREWQAHDGVVDTNAPTPSVQYAYDWDDDTQTDEAAPYLRLSKMTYPDGREIYYNYAVGTDNDISRVSEIADDDTSPTETYAVYGYLGAGTIVSVSHPAVSGGLVLSYGDDGSAGWDQFGRVTDQTWTNDTATTTFDDFVYTYDHASNRLTRTNELNSAFSEVYTYDDLNRLIDTNRGGTDYQSWDLDTVGNWDEFDDQGTTQTRETNTANEITDLSGTTDDPTYDAAGNMTANQDLLYEYDAWNRMTAARNRSDQSLISSYEYDGQRRRIVETIENGENDITRDSYYDASWQVVQVNEGGDEANPLEQYVWDLRYVDSPVVRFHDDNTDGTIDDTLYYTTDANFNVTAVIDENGNVVERYAYSSYGTPEVLNGSIAGDDDVDGTIIVEWSPDSSGPGDGLSDVDNRILYAGYHYDIETGLYHVRNRMYDPTMGTWLQRDPLGYAEARRLLQEAMPDAVELPRAVAGKPYPKPPAGVKKWYQLHPPEPEVGNNFPHFKYEDWTGGKKKTGGSWGM